MFTWIRRFLAPHPLPLNETLARLERLSWVDMQELNARGSPFQDERLLFTSLKARTPASTASWTR
jgi:hypothetical protein